MKKFFLTALLAGLCVAGTAISPAWAQTAQKPNVTILATGGTIAGSAASKTDTTGYTAGSLGIDVLINAVPQMLDVANVKGEQVANVASSNVDDVVLLTLSKRINELLNKEGQDGVVITHGTDTMEGTAFFLSMTVKSDKPVVLVGAMRPATAISADGPMNLLSAVTLAGSPDAKGRGPLIVMNDRIAPAYYVSKTNSTMVDAFQVKEQGYLGMFTSGKPRFYYTPAKPMNQVYFDASKFTSLPYVEIIYAYQGQDATLLKALVEKGAKGVIVAGSGNGGLTKEMLDEMKALSDSGFPVVLTTKTGSGYVSEKPYAISSGFLNADKARLLLQLALATGASNEQIKVYFDNQR